MGADDNIRSFLLEQLHEGPRIEFVERQSAPLVLPWFVEIVIQPSQNIRHAVDHLDISLGIKVAKHLVRIFQDVDVADLPHRPHADQRAFDGLGGAKVARASGCR